MDIVDITQEIYESAHRLQTSGDALFKLAKEKADKERIYRRALQVEIVTLRTDKVQATLISDIARGMTADQKFERDLAESRYDVARDNVRAISTQLSALQSILRVQKDI